MRQVGFEALPSKAILISIALEWAPARAMRAHREKCDSSVLGIDHDNDDDESSVFSVDGRMRSRAKNNVL